ncbi:MAG: HDIG domain-containing protein [Bacteroidaceae bacterium]|nr:HDIG domain-containing protein [Bacteroidaceae bacterium]
MKPQNESNKIGQWLTRSILFVITVALLVYFFPRQGETRYVFQEGRPWSYSLLTAPFDIPIYKDEARLNYERDSVLNDMRPVFIKDNTITHKMIQGYSSELNALGQSAINQKSKKAFVDALQNIYNHGIISNEEYKKLSDDNVAGISIREDNTLTNRETTEFYTPKQAYEEVLAQFPDTYQRHLLQLCNLNKYIVANVVYDSITTNKVRDELLQKIVLSDGMIQAGERIVDRGEIITPEIYRILSSYELMLTKQNNKNTNHQNTILVGQILVFGCILAFLYFFLAFFRRRMWNNNRALILIMLLTTLLSIAAFITSTKGFHAIFLVPITIVPIVIVTFFDSRTAMYAHLITTIICSFAAADPMLYIFLQMVAGMAVIDSLNNLSKRSQLFRCTVIVFAVYAISYAGYILFTEGSITKISVNMIINLSINSVLLLFSYLLIYIFERIFGFLSSVTLVELSDINSPLLQKLSEEAPGTFQHAMQVSNLAAAAANHVRGNAQLVRTGALYHDIGKLSNPSFFTENQSGADSPHKNLDIIESARIIISHVDEGIKMAQKYGLPPQVQEFIATHHGHGKAKYFYNTYCNQHPGEAVDESLFTYPGHNPQTKETGIMMMADAVEAASRSLKEYNRESISKLVNNIIDAQISEGLLKETPLSFRDVETIKETFIDKLMTIYHTRIAYPTLNKQS